MGDVLIYVDAENVSKKQVLSALEEAKSSLQPGDYIRGKFYGQKESIQSLVEFYMDLGFEFVDTSIFAHNMKNVTDMKIVVDSVFDICMQYRNSIKSVYILSNDTDFNPLIYKLKSLQAPLKASIFDEIGELTSVEDLLKLLQVKRYLPITKDNAFSVLYESITEVTADKFLDDSLIITFLRERIDKLFFVTKQQLGVVLPSASYDDLKSFSFDKYWHALKKYSVCDVRTALDIYLGQIFGNLIKSRDAVNILKEHYGYKGR